MCCGPPSNEQRSEAAAVMLSHSIITWEPLPLALQFRSLTEKELIHYDEINLKDLVCYCILYAKGKFEKLKERGLRDEIVRNITHLCSA